MNLCDAELQIAVECPSNRYAVNLLSTFGDIQRDRQRHPHVPANALAHQVLVSLARCRKILWLFEDVKLRIGVHIGANAATQTTLSPQRPCLRLRYWEPMWDPAKVYRCSAGVAVDAADFHPPTNRS